MRIFFIVFIFLLPLPPRRKKPFGSIAYTDAFSLLCNKKVQLTGVMIPYQLHFYGTKAPKDYGAKMIRAASFSVS